MRKILMGFLLIALIAVGTVSAADLEVEGTMPAVIQCTWTVDPAFPENPWWEDVDASGHPLTGLYNDIASPLDTTGTCSDTANMADLDTYANVPTYDLAISASNGGYMKAVDTEGNFIEGGYALASPLTGALNCAGTYFNMGTFPTLEDKTGSQHFDFRFQQDIASADTLHPGNYKTVVTATVTV